MCVQTFCVIFFSPPLVASESGRTASGVMSNEEGVMFARFTLAMEKYVPYISITIKCVVVKQCPPIATSFTVDFCSSMWMFVRVY